VINAENQLSEKGFFCQNHFETTDKSLPMMIDHSREKLINAIIYFVKNTRHCHKVKLYKLLYFLDFTHYTEIGRNVTGLAYHAYEKGPFPIALDDEIKTPKDDFLEKIHITQKLRSDG